eukprot:gene4844-8429_t
MNVSKFVTEQKKLLLLEKEAEAEKSSNSKKVKIIVVTEVSVGLSGRTEGKFLFRGGSQDLTFRTGESIQLKTQETKEEKSSDPINGVVSIVTDKDITISLDGEFNDEWETKKLILSKIPNEVTYKRMFTTLDYLQQIESEYSHPAKKMINVAFYDKKPERIEIKDLNFHNSNLNDSQKEAIQFSLETNDISLILGPPGTGKTTTLVEIIRQAVDLGMKILVCGPSNISIDNIVEKLSDMKMKKMVRLGHPARIMDSIIKHSLDYNLLHGEGSSIVSNIRKDIEKEFKKLKKSKKSEKSSIWNEIKTLKKELRKNEKKAVFDVLKYSNIVLTTCTGAMDYSLKDTIFDLIIIDEACQSLETSCWIPLLKGKKCILAGDPFQLPPTILNTKVQKKLEITLFERLYKQHKNEISRMLNLQYRMNEEIMNWSSNEFYEGKLIAHDSVKDRLLIDFEGVEDIDETITPLFMIDTGSCGLEENDIEEGESRFNLEEAKLVVKHVEKLIESGLHESCIAIITPYSAQVHALKSLLLEKYEFMEIGTVDGFQGREKDAIIISMVRSNKNGDVGFLSDERRTNVAITRAKRHVCIIGDTDTLRTNQFLSRMSKYFIDNADVRSAQDYD